MADRNPIDDLLDEEILRREQTAYAAANAPTTEERTFATVKEASDFVGNTGKADMKRAPDGTWKVKRITEVKEPTIPQVDPVGFAREAAAKLLEAHPDTPDEDLVAIKAWADRRVALNKVRAETAEVGPAPLQIPAWATGMAAAAKAGSEAMFGVPEAIARGAIKVAGKSDEAASMEEVGRFVEEGRKTSPVAAAVGEGLGGTAGAMALVKPVANVGAAGLARLGLSEGAAATVAGAVAGGAHGAATTGTLKGGVNTALFMGGTAGLSSLFRGSYPGVARYLAAEAGAGGTASLLSQFATTGEVDPARALADAVVNTIFGVGGARQARARIEADLKSGMELKDALDRVRVDMEKGGRVDVPAADSMTPGVDAPVLGPQDGPVLTVPDVIVTTKKGPPGPKVVEAATKQAEAAAPVNEALRRFEARTGLKTATEPTPTEKPVPVANKAPLEAPTATPKPVEAGPATRDVAPATPDVAAPPVEAPRPEGVSIKNAAVEADRAARGAAPLPETAPEKRADWVTEATRRIKENPSYPEELISDLKRTGRPHDKVEAAALIEHRIGLNERLASAEAEVVKAAERGDLDAVKEAKIRADEIRNKDFEVSEVVGKEAGAEAARALGARAMVLDRQYDLLAMETRRRVVNNGAPLTEAQKARTKAIHDEISAAMKAKGAKPIPKVPTPEAVRAAEYGARNKLVTREAYNEALATLREKFSRMSAGIDPTALKQLAQLGAFHVEAGARSFAGWAKAMVEDLGDSVRPHLREAWRASQIALGEPGRPDAERLASLKARLEMATADYEARVKMGKLRKPKREPVVRDEEAIRAEAALDVAKRKWEAELARDEWNNKSTAQKAGALALSGVHNLSRALMTAYDFSAPFRQGMVLSASHPIRAAKALGPMFKAFASKEYQARSEAEIRMDPMYATARKAGLFLSEHMDARAAKMEETVVTGVLAKIPGVGASQRAYTTFLNRLRFDVFKAGLSNLSAGKTPTPAEARAWAKYVNVATGRGGPPDSTLLNGLSHVFFAPRLMVSRFQMLSAEPLIRASGASRRLIAKEYARTLAGVGVVYALARMAGGDVEKNGKIRFGDSVLDPLAGLSQAAVLVSRTVPPLAKAAAGEPERVGYGKGGAASAVGRYLRLKLAPVPGALLNLATGEDPVGRKTSLGKEAAGLVMPMSYRDIYKALEEHGVPKGAALGLLSLFGMGLQNYRAKGR